MAMHCAVLCAVLFYALRCFMHCAVLCTVLFYALCCFMHCAVLCTVLFYVLCCFMCCAGFVDLFCVRVMPSRQFDMLKEDFDYFAISSVLLGVTVASVISQKLAARKALMRAWK